jgi:hypothetical protein
MDARQMPVFSYHLKDHPSYSAFAMPLKNIIATEMQ